MQFYLRPLHPRTKALDSTAVDVKIALSSRLARITGFNRILIVQAYTSSTISARASFVAVIASTDLCDDSHPDFTKKIHFNLLAPAEINVAYARVVAE